MGITPPDTNTATHWGLHVKYDSTQATSEATSTELVPGVRRLMTEGAMPACIISSATTCSPRAKFESANAADCTTVEIGHWTNKQDKHMLLCIKILMKVFQSTVSFLTQQSFKLKITRANAQFLVPAEMNNTGYLDSFWLQAITVCHFHIGVPPPPGPLPLNLPSGGPSSLLFGRWSRAKGRLKFYFTPHLPVVQNLDFCLIAGKTEDPLEPCTDWL